MNLYAFQVCGPIFVHTRGKARGSYSIVNTLLSRAYQTASWTMAREQQTYSYEQSGNYLHNVRDATLY